MRVLFFNEGNLGSHIMGQGQLTAALERGLEQVPDAEARFAGLEPMGRVSAAFAGFPVPVLGPRELDLRRLRWHLVQSARALHAIRRELRAWPADVLHLHSHSVALLPLGAPRVRSALSLDTTIEAWAQMPAWRSSRAHADAVMSPVLALERRALERAGLTLAWTGWAKRGAEKAAPRARVVEHHPGIDLARYRPAPRRPRELPRVLFVGGRFAEKGGQELLQALEGELGRSVELDLVTPAEVPARPGLRVHRLAPSDPALLDLQQQADLFCLPTHGDAAPWAVLEAMACGTPVLSTRIGGIPDLLADGRSGLLVEHDRPRELAQALRSMLGDEQLRARLAGEARERCERRYDALAQVPAMLELLRAI